MFGDALYRALDAIEWLKQKGLDVGLIKKPRLNLVDEEIMTKLGKSLFVVVIECFNCKTGLGSRFDS